MDVLREKLDALRRHSRPRAREESAVGVVATESPLSPVLEPPLPTLLPSVLGGVECPTAVGPCWQLVCLFEHTLAGCSFGDCAAPGTLLRFDPRDVSVPINPRTTLVLDIETGGFAGTPVFLIGVVRLSGRPPAVEQYLARDYTEERAILTQFAQLLETHDSLVSFNGKSFDYPFLADRFTLHRVSFRAPRVHLDLLHAARRRWKHELPDCRLETLERHILERSRHADIPGCDVPDLFHHFIRTGNAAPLRGVLEHNRRDLIACAELLQKLAVSDNL